MKPFLHYTLDVNQRIQSGLFVVLIIVCGLALADDDQADIVSANQEPALAESVSRAPGGPNALPTVARYMSKIERLDKRSGPYLSEETARAESRRRIEEANADKKSSGGPKGPPSLAKYERLAEQGDADPNRPKPNSQHEAPKHMAPPGVK